MLFSVCAGLPKIQKGTILRGLPADLCDFETAESKETLICAKTVAEFAKGESFSKNFATEGPLETLTPPLSPSQSLCLSHPLLVRSFSFIRAAPKKTKKFFPLILFSSFCFAQQNFRKAVIIPSYGLIVA